MQVDETLISKIADKENLIWAWRKTKKYLQMHDVWYSDELEIYKFEANLSNEIKNIQALLREGSYKLEKIKPIPFPKHQDLDGKPQSRQTFWISVKDQVVWIAFVNIVGPIFERKMPTWSYGNRLYRTIWYEESDENKNLKIGPFRHASGNIFKKWHHSYPLYKRHILYTLKRMHRMTYVPDKKDEKERQDFIDQDKIQEEFRLKYLTPNYWQRNSENIYWASVDLEKFYPKINLNLIVNIFSESDTRIKELLNSLLKFEIDFSDFSEKERKRLCTAIQLDETIIKHNVAEYQHLPTGLIVGGFLANLALFEIDLMIDSRLAKNNKVAHFRYVDDHIFLATSFDTLIEWIKDYELLLMGSNLGTSFQAEKTEPKELGRYLRDSKKAQSIKDLKKIRTQALKSCRIDPLFPSPLLTQSLTKLSEIANTEFDLLNSEEEDEYINELERLLLTDLPALEIRPDTRITFAASRLAINAKKKGFFSDELYEITKQETLNIKVRQNVENYINKLKQDQRVIQSKEGKRSREVSRKIATKNTDLKQLQTDLESIIAQKKILEKRFISERSNYFNRIFDILLKALREYPDKVRVWAKSIEFAYETGIPGGCDKIYSLIEKLKTQHKINHFSSVYLKAFVIQVYTEMIFRALRNVLNSNINTYEKEHSIAFLESVISKRLLNSINNLKEKIGYDFVQIKVNVFLYSLGVLKFIISHCNNISDPDKHQYKLLLTNISKLSLPNINSIEVLSSLSVKHAPKDWYWYGILKTTVWGESVQNPLFFEGLRQITNGKLDLVRLFLLFPRDIPDKYIFNILIDERFYKLKENHNFIFELCQKRSKFLIETNLLSQVPTPVQQSMGNKYNLYAWIDFLENLQRINPFDIRITEWFNLLLMHNIITTLKSLNYELNKTNVVLHPANIILPQEIFDESYFRGKSWNESKKKVNELKIQFSPDGIKDDFTLFQSTNKNFKKYFEARLFGLLLLSLCTRTLKLPSIWNLPILSEVYENQVLSKISHNPLSSWTTAIIYACLSSRSKESFWQFVWDIKEKGDDDDTVFEQLQIRSVDDLCTEITNAITILSKHQISVFNNEPRQMIPIFIEQMHQNDFSKLKD